jgi:hypothetical protein
MNPDCREQVFSENRQKPLPEEAFVLEEERYN